MMACQQSNLCAKGTHTCTMNRIRLSRDTFSVSLFILSKYTFMRCLNSSLEVPSSLPPTVESSLQRHSMSSGRGRDSSWKQDDGGS